MRHADLTKKAALGCFLPLLSFVAIFFAAGVGIDKNAGSSANIGMWVLIFLAGIIAAFSFWLSLSALQNPETATSDKFVAGLGIVLASLTIIISCFLILTGFL